MPVRMDHCSCSDYGCLPDYLSHENHEENKQAYQVFRLVIRAIRNIHAYSSHHDYRLHIQAAASAGHNASTQRNSISVRATVQYLEKGT